MTENRDQLIGKTLGQFEIIEEIGRGGMATVYRARQRSVNRAVAVKVLPPMLMHDPSFLERFTREVEVITQLEHPHILPIIDYGEAEGVPYIAMRYLGGGSLEQRIRRGGLDDLRDVLKPIRQIAQALDHAHGQGVIHRDLKPGNIMLDESGNAYLSDFGIARVLGSQLTGSMVVGTPAYMSPEQANGLPLDGRSDIYALGVVLFELLTGRSPFEAETPMAMLLKHINEPMPLMRAFNPDVPVAVESVVQQATAKDPADRFVSATQMVNALEAALNAQPPSTTVKLAPRASSAAQTDASSAPTQNEPTAPEVKKSQPRITEPLERAATRSVPLWLVGLLILVVVGAVAVMFALSSRVEQREVAAQPTPFPRASIIDQDEYRITIPDEWIPASLFTDLTTDGYDLLHTWRSQAGDAMVSLGIVPLNGGSFAAAVADYDARSYKNEGFTLIDSATAENGVIRRSYKMVDQRDFPPAQADVFYFDEGDSLAVLELVTADFTANSLVPRMQLILDSLRFKRATPER